MIAASPEGLGAEPKRGQLSLAVITGDVGVEMMERFVRSFGAAVDEVVLVKACGARNDSGRMEATLTRGVEVCQQLGVRCVVGSYYNKAENSEWEHVDDFAAARNVAWELASGEFLMWADTDDVLIETVPDTLRTIIGHSGDKFEMLKIAYTIPDLGQTVMRERIARRGVASWISAVHECLEPKPFYEETGTKARVGTIDQADVEFVHRPSSARKSGESSERNLRILESLDQANLSTSLRYQKWVELNLAKRYSDMVRAAWDFLNDPKGGPVERAETFLRLAHFEESPKGKADLLTLSWRECPERREPLAGLAEIALRAGDLKRATAYLDAMKGLPMPKEEIWTLRKRWWGWAGIQHEARVLRLKNEHVKADALELNHFVQNDGKISLLHATRGRPMQAVEARQRWYDRAANPDAIEHIFAIDLDDAENSVLGMERHVLVVDDRNPGVSKGPVAAWNAALAISHGKVIVQMSDDWDPPLHWDKLIQDRIAETGDRKEGAGAGSGDPFDRPIALAVSDGSRTDGLICMAICTRSALQRNSPLSGLRSPVYLFHPAFFSMYSDNWFTEEMRGRGIVIDAPDLVFEHLHPAFGKGEMDATYARSNQVLHFATGWEILQQLRRGRSRLTDEEARKLSELSGIQERRKGSDVEVFTWRDIEGWGGDSAGMLHGMVMRDLLPDGETCAVEIGVAYGRGLACMGTISRYLWNTSGKNIAVWGIDTFKGTVGETTNYAEDMGIQCRQNLERCRLGYLTVHEWESHAPGVNVPPQHYIYIDAAHDYESAKRDILAWLPRLAPGGVIAGHDYFDAPGVKQAVDETFGDKVQTLGECWYVVGAGDRRPESGDRKEEGSTSNAQRPTSNVQVEGAS